MTITEHLQGVRRLFLDTAPVIYFVEKNLAYIEHVKPVFALIDAGELQAVTSPITLEPVMNFGSRDERHL